MRRLGRPPWSHRNWAAVQHAGRLFDIFQRAGEVWLGEIVLSEEPEFALAGTGLEARPRGPGRPRGRGPWDIAACSLGSRILVVYGAGQAVSAALLEVGEGRLREEGVRATGLAVEGAPRWGPNPFLAPLSEGRALLGFDQQRGLWRCEVSGGALSLRGLEAALGEGAAFSDLPARLPGGGLLAAVLGPRGPGLGRLAGEGARLEGVWELPGGDRAGMVPAPLGERFAVGFGGWDGGLRDDLWVFDLRARRASPVARGGEWHPPDFWVLPVARGGALYLCCGARRVVSAVSLPELAARVRDRRVRTALRRSLGLPQPADPRFSRADALRPPDAGGPVLQGWL